MKRQARQATCHCFDACTSYFPQSFLVCIAPTEDSTVVYHAVVPGTGLLFRRRDARGWWVSAYSVAVVVRRFPLPRENRCRDKQVRWKQEESHPTRNIQCAVAISVWRYNVNAERHRCFSMWRHPPGSTTTYWSTREWWSSESSCHPRYHDEW